MDFVGLGDKQRRWPGNLCNYATRVILLQGRYGYGAVIHERRLQAHSPACCPISMDAEASPSASACGGDPLGNNQINGNQNVLLPDSR